MKTEVLGDRIPPDRPPIPSFMIRRREPPVLEPRRDTRLHVAAPLSTHCPTCCLECRRVSRLLRSHLDNRSPQKSSTPIGSAGGPASTPRPPPRPSRNL